MVLETSRNRPCPRAGSTAQADFLCRCASDLLPRSAFRMSISKQANVRQTGNSGANVARHGDVDNSSGRSGRVPCWDAATYPHGPVRACATCGEIRMSARARGVARVLRNVAGPAHSVDSACERSSVRLTTRIFQPRRLRRRFDGQFRHFAGTRMTTCSAADRGQGVRRAAVQRRDRGGLSNGSLRAEQAYPAWPAAWKGG